MSKVLVLQGWLEGEILESSLDKRPFHSFKGIPYATPPLGKLRFKAPLPPHSWNGVREAKEHGPVSPQYEFKTIPGNEDCLYLNVYTPHLKPSKPLAVMVYIHGGSFKSGSGNQEMIGPDYLISHGVVLVTINYRLETFGFLCLDTEEVPGNAGLKDQVLALKWVKKNINNFGGDPNNITIFGHSAGGASCSLHILSPLSKGLFNRCILMSGVVFCDWSIPFESRRRAFALGRLLGFDTEDPNELLEFLQSVSSDKLIDVNPTVFPTEEFQVKIQKVLCFVPVVEKDFGNKQSFINEEPFDIIKSGKINEVDVLAGYTSLETLLALPLIEKHNVYSWYNTYPEYLCPRKIFLNSTMSTNLEVMDRIRKQYFGKKTISNKTLNEMFRYSTDYIYMYDIIRFIKLLIENSRGKRYLYKFTGIANRNVFSKPGLDRGIIGVAHIDDLMYLFDGKLFNINNGPKELNIIKQICTAFTNFAKYGVLTTQSSQVTWPEFGEDEYFGNIDETITVSQHPDAEAFQFWKSIYDYAGLPFL